MYTKSNRIQLVDTIRGIALLGILMFNIQTFTLFAFLNPQQVYQLHLDQKSSYIPLQFLLHVFVNGQFYTMYSFLFGLGFYMLWKKNQSSGFNPKKIYIRRLLVLLCIGLMHGFLIWFGDILHKYALLGFSLIYFRRKSVNTLFKWILFLISVSLILQILSGFTFQSGGEKSLETEKVVMQVVDVWQNGTFLQVLNLQKLGVLILWVMNIMNGFSGFVHYLVMFLFGLIAGKSRFFIEIHKYWHKLRRLFFLFLPISLSLKIISNMEFLGIHLSTIPVINYIVPSVLKFISVPILTLCYIVIIIMISGRLKNFLFLTYVSNAGRMSLTNYLSQSIICSILFYGFGFGLSGKLTLLQSIEVAVIIFTVQVIFSTFWLKYFTVGPMEKIWRKLSVW